MQTYQQWQTQRLNYLTYVQAQDDLWNAYEKARRTVDNATTLQAMSDAYDRLMRHLEGCYYQTKMRQKLSDQELTNLFSCLNPLPPAKEQES